MTCRSKSLRAALVLAVLAGASSTSPAQTYEVSWWTVDGGGANGSGGPFAVAATCGQPDAGGPFAGGPYSAVGGFWSLAAGGSLVQANLLCAKTDGQATAVPGLPVTYTIVVSNAGPDAASGATVADALPPALGGATWTCAPAGGASCTASGSGGISDLVALPPGAAVTYTLTALVDPAATGTLANTATVTPPAGVADPAPADNTSTDTDTLTPRADLALVKTASADPVRSREALRYTLQVTNLGPSVSPSATVVDSLPSALGFVGATAGCAYAPPDVSCALGPLAPQQAASVVVDTLVTPRPVTGVVNTASVSGGATDPNGANDTATLATGVVFRATGELAHGTRVAGDLAGLATLADEDHYRLAQPARSSFEVVLDEASGDVGVGDGPALDRVAAGGTAVLQSAQPVGAGSARSLRFVNATSAAIEDENVRVRSQGCGSDCGADDRYRLRAYETTYSVPRFNNGGSQLTVLLLQNPTAARLGGTVFFWDASGALLREEPFDLAPHAQAGLLTALLPGLAGQSGTATIVHDGPYGALAGKAVALEPATGFSFDTPLVPRPR